MSSKPVDKLHQLLYEEPHIVFEHKDPLSLYLKEIGHYPLLSKEEEIELAQQIKAGNQDAKNTMIQSNLRLVVKVARQYVNRGLMVEDLIEEGNLGLMHAVDKFDHRKGCRFSTYAIWWIRQTIERTIMNQSRLIRLPIHVVKALGRYLRGVKALEKDEPPNTHHSQEELSIELDMSVKRINQFQSLADSWLSLQLPLNEDSDKTLAEICRDKSALDPEDSYAELESKLRLIKIFKALDPKEQQVILRRFGLLGYPEQTLEEVGEEVGLTRERVRQIQIEALEKMKPFLNS